MEAGYGHVALTLAGIAVADSRIYDRVMNADGDATLASTVDELRREGVEEEQVSNQTTALEAALASVVGSARRTEVRQRVEDGPIGGSSHGLS